GRAGRAGAHPERPADPHRFPGAGADQAGMGGANAGPGPAAEAMGDGSGGGRQGDEPELQDQVMARRVLERKDDRATAAAGVPRANPLGRTGTADEVADLVSFLVSEPANCVTGSTVSIDGGYHRYVFG